MAKVITVNALPEGVVLQTLLVTKEPGQPVMCHVTIVTDQGPPLTEMRVSFPLSAVSGGPSNAEMKAIRDHALALLEL